MLMVKKNIFFLGQMVYGGTHVSGQGKISVFDRFAMDDVRQRADKNFCY